MTNTVRDVIGPVLDPLPPVAREPAGAVLNTTEAAAETVDGTLAPLLS